MGRLIIFGHVLASWELDQVEYGDYELLELRELLVEQRGIEPWPPHCELDDRQKPKCFPFRKLQRVLA